MSEGNSSHNVVNIESTSAPGVKLAGMRAARHFAERIELVLLMREHVSQIISSSRQATLN